MTRVYDIVNHCTCGDEKLVCPDCLVAIIDKQERELAAAQAEIERLKNELAEIADSCAKTSLEIEWCNACTSRKWCKKGMSLVEAAERGKK